MVEPEWDEATRNMALGYAAVDLCGVCGGPAFLCQDPELQDSWRAGEPIRCHRTTAVRERQGRINDQENPHSDALIWPVELIVPRGEA